MDTRTTRTISGRSDLKEKGGQSAERDHQGG